MSVSITIDLNSPETVAKAIEGGLTTIEQVADWVCDDDLAVIEGETLVLRPGTWHADYGNAEVTGEFDSGLEAAEHYVETGDWGSSNKTSWVDIWVWRTGVSRDGEVIQVDRECHKITIEPTEPKCGGPDNRDPHEWEDDGGPYGHGAGVVYYERCAKCGLRKKVDTYAQDPQDGTQGHTSVQYGEDREE